MDQPRPELGVAQERLRWVAEDPLDLRAHVGQPAAVRDRGILHVDVDGRRNPLDEHPVPGVGRRALDERDLELVACSPGVGEEPAALMREQGLANAGHEDHAQRREVDQPERGPCSRHGGGSRGARHFRQAPPAAWRHGRSRGRARSDHRPPRQVARWRHRHRRRPCRPRRRSSRGCRPAAMSPRPAAATRPRRTRGARTRSAAGSPQSAATALEWQRGPRNRRPPLRGGGSGRPRVTVATSRPSPASWSP